MRKLLTALLLTLMLPVNAATLPFINEIHYDNGGTDVGEGVELAGAAGTSLENWSLQFYNGSTGAIYRTVKLTGTISDQMAGYGTVFFTTGALQNGAPDGVALVDDNDVVLQFLSYEGRFLALEGAAAGMLSSDIGIFESSDTLAGSSLQLIGSGVEFGDFSWTAANSSYGLVNTNQEFSAVPLPASLPLLAGALGWLLSRRKCCIT